MKIICHYCGEEFERSPHAIRQTRKSKWLAHIDTCKACIPKKKADINAARAAAGDSPHTGHKQDPETMKRAAKKRIESEGYQRMLEDRTGKTLEEFYGEEGAKNTQEAHKRKRERQAKTGEWPNAGKHHSDEAKQKMSQKRKEWFAEDPSRVESIRERNKQWYANLSEEDRKAFVRKSLKGLDRRHKWASMSYWYSDDTFSCHSSYEQKYAERLNAQQLPYIKNNNNLLIPFTHPITGATKYYLPDFIVYTDMTMSEIERVIEVKPSVFLDPNVTTEYAQICQAKERACIEYCESHAYIYERITEQELGG